MAREPRLPYKLSDCLEMALKDVNALERSKKFVIDLDWGYICTPSRKDGNEGKCSVCAAGAVMVRRLNADITKLDSNSDVFSEHEITPWDFSSWNRDRLVALDCLRQGNVQWAIEELGTRKNPDFEYLNREVTPYEENRGKWKRDMRKLIRDLREAKL